MGYTYEDKYCVADNALLMIAKEIMKYTDGKQTVTTTVEQTRTIINAYAELRTGVMRENE